MLADIIKHMTPDRAFEEAYPQVLPDSTSDHIVDDDADDYSVVL